jgi:anti-sigma regulatory factor (Ser/Thr protein kinase)
LFYSDGLTETRNASGELFGIERLADCVGRYGRLEPRDLIERIRLEAVAFAGSERFGDDLTCVAVRIEERQLPQARAELEISSDLKELARARMFVRDVCARLAAPVDEDTLNQLELAMTEAASNVMRHAYSGRTDRRIQLSAEIYEDRIVLRLHHLGQSFDPDAIRPPKFDGTEEGGFGMYIISQTVDEVRYHRDERGRNCISRIKKRR